MPHPPKRLEQVAAKCRVKHYSIRTERAYVDWVKRFILFHGKRHPKEMGGAEIELPYLDNVTEAKTLMPKTGHHGAIILSNNLAR